MEFKKIGEDVNIADFVVIKRPELVTIGNHVAIDSFFYSTTQMEIGDYVHISPHVGVIGGKNGLLKIGNFCFVSLGARLICASEEFFGEGLIGPIIPAKYHDKIICAPIVFEDHAGVAANVTILPGVTLAEGSVIAANSLVTRSTEPWTIYKGSPAKPYKERKATRMLKYASELRREEIEEKLKTIQNEIYPTV
jgi:acetyltransferase-like isoleucine patch superfamily enzyme